MSVATCVLRRNDLLLRTPTNAFLTNTTPTTTTTYTLSVYPTSVRLKNTTESYDNPTLIRQKRWVI